MSDTITVSVDPHKVILVAVEPNVIGLVRRVRNETGATLAKGKLVAATGFASGKVLVSLSDKDTPATSPALGILLTDLPDNTDGTVLTVGTVVGFDTSLLTLTDQLFLGNTGDLTSTLPATGVIQPVATVSRVHATLGQLALNVGGVDQPVVASVPLTRNLTAGAGLTGGGTLAADRTFDVVANADGSIVVNANDIQVGVLATDAQHGSRGGGALHTSATTSATGFIELATQAEVDTGTDAVRAVTPATLAAAATVLHAASIGTTVQAWDADLDAVAALASTGLAVRTAASIWAVRTLTGPAAGLVVTNGDGVAGNPTLSLANDLAGLEGLSGTGYAVRTAADTWTNRTIAAASASVVVTNGDGVAGNTTVEVAAATDTLQGKIELATQAEVDTGTDTTRAVTPSTLKNRSARGTPIGWGADSIASTTVTRYLTPGWGSGTAPTARVPWIVTHAGTLDLLRAAHDTAPGNANAVVYTVRKNGVAAALTVSVAANSTAMVSDTTNTVTVAAGDIIDIEVTKAVSIGTSPTNPAASFRFTPT